ncbi:MAG: hypothetical protein E6X72_00435 [Clostridioides difficile]|nr:hypothetical protein [Clostridioides difficile]
MDISKITSDGWINFIGAIISSIMTVISILIAIFINNKQIKQQRIQLIKPYHDALKRSLPSYEGIMTQSDYLDEKDNLLGGFVSVEGRLYILEKHLNDTIETDGLLEYKIDQHKKYIKYWDKADSNIKRFINSDFYNAAISECSDEIIKCYSIFLVSFSNEHFYSGKVITTEVLRENLNRLFDAIGKEEKL